MKLVVFSPDFQTRNEVTHAISFQMSDYYNDIGKFTLVLPLDNYNISISENDAILYEVEKNLAYEVAEVQIDCDANQITWNGFSLNNRLERRAIINTAYVENIEHDCYEIVKSNLRDLTISVAAEKGLTEKVDKTGVTGATLLTGLKPVLAQKGLGQRAAFDYKNKKIVWEIYKGNDLSSGLKAVSFVSEWGTAPGLKTDRDVSAYKNVCYCSARYRDETPFYAVAGSVSGDERRELIVEYGGDAQEETESNEDFYEKVKNYAALQLGNYLNRNSFSVDCDADEIGNAYNIGDIVWCVSLQLGIKFKTRISGAKYTFDKNGKTSKLVLGDPIKTIEMR